MRSLSWKHFRSPSIRTTCRLCGQCIGLRLDPSREVAASKACWPSASSAGFASLASSSGLRRCRRIDGALWRGFLTFGPRLGTAVAFDGSAAAFLRRADRRPAFLRALGWRIGCFGLDSAAGWRLCGLGSARHARDSRGCFARTRDLDDLLLEAFAPGADHRAVIEGRIGERGHRLVGLGGVAADLRTLLHGASGLQIVQKLPRNSPASDPRSNRR